MFHINNNNESKPCKAKSPENCDFYNGEDDARHYETAAEASKASEKLLEKELGATKKNVRYSFVKEFKIQEEKFKQDFDGFPTRFFNADLRGNRLMSRGLDLEKFTEDEAILDPDIMKGVYVNPNDLSARLASFSSSTSDLKTTDEEIVKLAEEMGFTNIRKVENPKTLSALDSDRAWVADMGNQQVAITGSAKNSKNFSSYRFRGSHEEFDQKRGFTFIDARIMAGAKRVQRKTGVNLLVPLTASGTVVGRRLQSVQVLKALSKLEDAQFEGTAFKAQQKYVKESAGSIATVWLEKKDTDDVRKELAAKSKLKGAGKFREIDLDNDVDPEVFKEFEKDFLKVQEHLPKFPKGKEPSLHIRKLGKHSSASFHVHGLFNPVKNSVAVDLRKSSSTVHEIFHQWDLISKKNISLSPEFRELAKEYSKDLKVPDGMEAKSGYYTTATEVAARMGEIYAHSKIGDDTMLLDSSKFENFDYAPIMNNPELKKKVFDFFEKHMKDAE